MRRTKTRRAKPPAPPIVRLQFARDLLAWNPNLQDALAGRGRRCRGRFLYAVRACERPLILELELNARPGLNIQIANRSGLLPRLQLVERVDNELRGVEERIAFAKTHFQAAV